MQIKYTVIMNVPLHNTHFTIQCIQYFAIFETVKHSFIKHFKDKIISVGEIVL